MHRINDKYLLVDGSVCGLIFDINDNLGYTMPVHAIFTADGSIRCATNMNNLLIVSCENRIKHSIICYDIDKDF